MTKDTDEDNDKIEEIVDDQSSGVSDEDDELSKLREEFDNLQSQFNDLTNQLKRAVADYQNLEKRVAEGRAELASWATGELVKKLLPVVDLFDKALTTTSEEEKSSGWYKGVAMAVKQFKSVLKEEGLVEIEADGQFDPSLHEAVDIKAGKDNEILEVVEKGYTVHGKIVKPAKVVVGRKEKS